MAARTGGRGGRYVRDKNGKFARSGGIGGGRQKVTVPRNFKVSKADPLAVSIAARAGHGAKPRKLATTTKLPSLPMNGQQYLKSQRKALSATSAADAVVRATKRTRRTYNNKALLKAYVAKHPPLPRKTLFGTSVGSR